MAPTTSTGRREAACTLATMAGRSSLAHGKSTRTWKSIIGFSIGKLAGGRSRPCRRHCWRAICVVTFPITRHLCFFETMDILLTYDIADTGGAGAGRLRRISDVCEKYGQRVQFSVFQFRLSPARLARLMGEVEDVIDKRSDSVILYRFPGCLDEAAIHLGLQKGRNLGSPWLV